MLKKLAELEYQTQLKITEDRRRALTNEFGELVKREFNRRFVTNHDFTGFYFSVEAIAYFTNSPEQNNMEAHIETVDDLKFWAGLKDMPKPYVEEDVIFSLLVHCPGCEKTISSKPINSIADIGKYLKAIEIQSNDKSGVGVFPVDIDLAAECYPHHKCFEH